MDRVSHKDPREEDPREYLPLVYKIANSLRGYSLPSIDVDDFVSIGLIAVWRAQQTWNPSGAPFRQYVARAIANSILRQFAPRYKAMQSLASEISLNEPRGDSEDGEITLGDILAADPRCEPERAVLSAVAIGEVWRRIERRLTPMQWRSLVLWLASKDEGQGAISKTCERLGIPRRQFDNHLINAKRRLVNYPDLIELLEE